MDVSQLSDEELLKQLPDEVVLRLAQGSSTPPPATSQLPTSQIQHPFLYDMGAAPLQGLNAMTGGVLKALYERPAMPNPRLEAMGHTVVPQPPRQFPTPVTLPGKIAGLAQTGAGAMMGLPAFAGLKAAEGLAAIAPQLPAWLARAGSGAAGGLAFDVAKPETYARNATVGAVGAAVIPPAIEKIAGRFAKKPQTLEELAAIPPEQVQTLSKSDQAKYFQVKNQQLRVQTEAQTQALKQDRIAIQRELGKTAQERTLEIRAKLPELYAKQSQHFQDLIEAQLEPVANKQIADSDLVSFLEHRYSKDPEMLNAVSARLGLSNETASVQEVPTGILDEFGKPLTSTVELPSPGRTVRSLYQQAKEFGQSLPSSVRASLRTYTPDEHLNNESIATLLDYLKEKQGVDLSAPRQFWAGWKPIQKQATTEFRPFLATDTQTRAGSQRLIKLAQGIDPDNRLYAEELSRLVGMDNLPGEVNQVVAKLNANQKSLLATHLSQQEAAGQLAAQQYVAGRHHEASVEKWTRVLKIVRALEGVGMLGAGVYGVKKVLGR